ncbi:MAG: hypothetical protein Q8L85_00855 [Alphaproteobacteria bacterium]|nr:hypothetical protein [Alphaproteobacteria bacterium]
MTKFIQKILIFITFLTSTNSLFAQKWPYFSTEEIKGNYIELNKSFKKSSKIKDSTYQYYIKHPSEFRKPINNHVETKKSSVLLIPDEEKSTKKKVKYFIFINDYMTGTTDIHRKKTKK